jgi:hypothetical protein
MLILYFFLSLLGCILQCYALIKAKEKSRQAVASILISALTAGMTGAAISFE